MKTQRMTKRDLDCEIDKLLGTAERPLAPYFTTDIKEAWPLWEEMQQQPIKAAASLSAVLGIAPQCRRTSMLITLLEKLSPLVICRAYYHFRTADLAKIVEQPND